MVAQGLSSAESFSHPFPALAHAGAHPGCPEQWGWAWVGLSNDPGT